VILAPQGLNWRRAARAVAFAGAGAFALLVAGCGSGASKAAPRGPAAQENAREALFESVAEKLDRLEEFDVNQMLPQICDRLNQWYQQEKPEVNWQRDPLVDQLPEELQKLRVVQTLDLMRFRLPDAWYLQETAWLRDISQVARADQFEDVAVAERLFDWTVRNIQLEPEPDASSTPAHRHRPYETILYGRGTALERAWVFTLLARQQGLDVVLLALAEGEGKPPRPWLPALATGDQLYLFDARLGLPIPGPNGKAVATLAEVKADDALLRRLDLDEAHPYPVKSSDLDRVVALVEASPQALSKRMALVESRLAGKRKMILVSPGNKLAEQVKKLPGVSDARLWNQPFDIWLWQSKLGQRELQAAGREMVVFQAMPTLLKARALYFKGAYDGETGAKQLLLKARPPDEMIEDYKLPREVAQKMRPEDIPRIEAAQAVILYEAKRNASFWLGLVCYAEKDYPVAIDYFAKRTLAATPDGPWTAAARYNLARAYEAQGRFAEAIALLEDSDSVQSHGDKLRARFLRERSATAKK
jgi:tetratricopeptide (TPR) repeat protein